MFFTAVGGIERGNSLSHGVKDLRPVRRREQGMEGLSLGGQVY